MADAAGNVNTPRLNVISFGVFILSVALAVIAVVQTKSPVWPIVIMLVGLVLMQSPRIAKQWERAVVLRLGRFVGRPVRPPSSGRHVHPRRRDVPRLRAVLESHLRKHDGAGSILRQDPH